MKHFTCTQTGETYPLTQTRWHSDQGALLDIAFHGSFDPDLVKTRPANMWRYREAIPIDSGADVVSFSEGMTPLIDLPWGGRSVQVKLDYLFPSGSYKDRGASVLMSHAKSLGVTQVVQDSSGNAGTAVAAYAAAAGIEAHIYIPASTSPAKQIQLAAYGAHIHAVPGTREQTADAALEAAASTFYASHVWNPFFYQGTKTFAYELCEQLGWQAPDTVILPAGNGTLILGAAIGFREMIDMGVIRHFPKLIGIQAANCAPLLRPFEQGSDHLAPYSGQPTYAEGIAIAAPKRGDQMIREIRNSGGTILAVEEAHIKEALIELCGLGQFVEPTSAAVLAGVSQYLQKHAAPDEHIATVLTGHGLKASQKIQKMLGLDR
ncbi:threonine synthase [Pontibacter sp. G13]|uniref:threonine synthase n=1 Tax=Pontibacter sp. G13 TaxID=3074898 RepID=UPI00288A7156|nr:threonine synthase [Pontibacter sp. G13]WNJ16947.1 threonine synthase [Pontibacter sp. G13]